MIYNLRIDADYAEPHGGFLPVKITYVWKEGDLGQRNVQVAAGPAKTYTITCRDKPVMESLIVELAK